MKLSTIQSSLAEIGMQPTRSLGQNFLHDQNLADWIVAQLELKPDEAWVELGPGLGALTEFAVRRSPRGLVIEKDGRLAEFLRTRFPELEVVHGDASDFDVRELFARGPVKVLGNLPYYVSSQLLFAFTAEPSPVSRLIFTLQRELAERLSAKPSTKEYGALTLLIGRRWRVKYLRTLPGSVFVPAPKVDSAIVALTPREPGEVPACDGTRFTALVKQGFSQRRKQLRKMLASYALDWPALCAHLRVPETCRGEELSLAQWVELTNVVADATRLSSAAPVETEAEASARRQLQAQDVHGEIFDVVDEADQVRGQLSRHEVHRQKLLHRAVHIFVFNQRGELFLQKRSKWKDVYPLRWDSSAAGHVNAGQTYDETAPREVEEELGVRADVARLATLPASKATGWEHVQLYRAEHEGPFRLNPAELDGGGFFTLVQVARWVAARPQDFATGFLECFRAFHAASSS
ncbi:MAG: rRNA (adenine1518-N6/adenine1519-N6)-dimethyltransferase [Chthoniobacter sp.]|jgi:16S rRNA (adenine1518-N6/adenine1519-N6)-dimethyltransferase|nr:rRNA (adenine1518-N6/adenine1519-N6)-dimethyltransferase [Chthoniobacter sp.]